MRYQETDAIKMLTESVGELALCDCDDYCAFVAQCSSPAVDDSPPEFFVLYSPVARLQVLFILLVLGAGCGSTKKALTVIFCCLSVLIFPRDLLAAKWSMESYVAVGGVYNDNVRLTTGPHESVSGANLTPGINTRRETATSLVNIDALLNATRYSDNDEQNDLDEQILRLRSRGQASERSSWRVDGRLIRDTLLRTVDIPGFDGDPDLDTNIGIVEQDVRRIRVRLRPSWTRAVTQRTSVTLGYRLTDNSYSDEQGTGLVDNETHGIAVTVAKELSQRNSIDLTVSASRHRAPDVDSETDNVEILGGITHTFSPTLSGTLRLGARDTSLERGALEDTDSGAVYEGRLTKRSELTRLVAILRRDIDITGIGRAVETDELALRLRRRVSPRLRFVLRARLFRHEALEGDPTDVDRDYAEVRPGLRWQWTRDRSVVGSYRYRRRKFDAEEESATSNALFVGLDFRGPR